MTGRQRLRAVLAGEPVDRLPWTTLVDANTLEALPAPLRGMDCLGFYRHVGCDILQLGGWGTPWALTAARLVMPGVQERRHADAAGRLITQSRCRRGTLTSITGANGHPITYPVKTVEEVLLLTSRYERSYWQAVDERESLAAIEQAVGDSGITTLFLPPSPIPELLQQQVGVQDFYYLLHDYPHEMEALIRTMQERDLVRFDIVSHHPCDIAMLVENTSTAYISPRLYERYNLPSQRAFVEAQHRQGKLAILHMCGHVRALLPLIKQTGTDGIHALTPPPLGDTPWETALEVLGEDLIIFACLPPSVFLSCPVQEMAPALSRLITPRLRAARFILNPFADGIPVPLERFLAVRDWVECCGRRL